MEWCEDVGPRLCISICMTAVVTHRDLSLVIDNPATSGKVTGSIDSDQVSAFTSPC